MTHEVSNQSADASKAGLRTDFRNESFQSFAVNASNQFAFDTAQSIAGLGSGMHYPVVFHATGDWGKTHLLAAIYAELIKDPDNQVNYLEGSKFASVATGSAGAFLERHGNPKVLLIDDLDLVVQSGNRFWMPTLTSLIEHDVHVVLAAWTTPVSLEIERRLRSYLSQGITCNIEKPDLELRVAILSRKLAALRDAGEVVDAEISVDALLVIATFCDDSVRNAIGALRSLILYSKGRGFVDAGVARDFIRSQFGTGTRRITVDEIQKIVSGHYLLRQSELISERRNRSIARPRQVAMWLAKKHTVRSLPDIGRRFGGRDHTTVLHAIRRIDELLSVDPMLRKDVEKIERQLIM